MDLKNKGSKEVRLLFFLSAFFCLSLSHNSFAVEPDEILQNADLEKRARSISSGLRCLVCQNQSIDDSDAPLAKDLRVLVRERLLEGETDQEVLDYIAQRYGQFVLLKPPFNLHTLLLWVSPLLLCLFGFFILLRSVRSKGTDRQSVSPLTETEEKKLGQILLEAHQHNDLK